jgi:hypothetical protein
VQKGDIMSAIRGATTEQAVAVMLFHQIASKHGIQVDFDFTDYRNPIVNFTGGTTQQHEALARELADKFQEV